MTERLTSPARPHLRVAVLMRREPVQGAMARWQPWRWTLAEVVPHEPGFGQQPPGFFHYATYCLIWHVFLLY